MTSILLDTCAVIWTGTKKQLIPAAVDAIDEMSDRDERMLVSPITAWELGLLVSRGRYRFSMDVVEWFTKYMENRAVVLAGLSPEVLLLSSYLPGNPPNDPADRIIIATARQYGYRIMTRDQKILDYAKEGHVNAIAC